MVKVCEHDSVIVLAKKPYQIIDIEVGPVKKRDHGFWFSRRESQFFFFFLTFIYKFFRGSGPLYNTRTIPEWLQYYFKQNVNKLQF